MIIEAKIRGFICTTAHPQGCAESVQRQISYVKKQGRFPGPKKALIVGASTGYGLASRIVAAFGSGAKTIGVFYEREPSDKRTATAGWYNTAAFEAAAKKEGLYGKSINGDAFSNDIKERTAALIEKELGKIDLLVYSLASPKRTDPTTQQTYHSVLKTIGQPFACKTIDTNTKQVTEVTIQPATQEEIDNTVAVMGGEDWQMWVDFLKKRNLLTEDFTTVTYSYIGSPLTFPIYRDGTIGKAKEHLEATAQKLNQTLQKTKGRALVAINKGLVTQASSAIPVVPLYISILYKVMKQKNIHENCIEQMERLFRDKLYAPNVQLDEQGRVRVDDYEMRDDIQEAVGEIWAKISNDNVDTLTDIKGYQEEFLRLFGFGYENIDYKAETDPLVPIPANNFQIYGANGDRGTKA